MFINGVHEIDGTNYYFDKDGVMGKGWIVVDGKWQYYKDDGSRTEKGIVKGDSIYVIKDGALITEDTIEVTADKTGAISVV